MCCLINVVYINYEYYNALIGLLLDQPWGTVIK